MPANQFLSYPLNQFLRPPLQWSLRLPLQRSLRLPLKSCCRLPLRSFLRLLLERFPRAKTIWFLRRPGPPTPCPFPRRNPFFLLAGALKQYSTRLRHRSPAYRTRPNSFHRIQRNDRRRPVVRSIRTLCRPFLVWNRAILPRRFLLQRRPKIHTCRCPYLNA